MRECSSGPAALPIDLNVGAGDPHGLVLDAVSYREELRQLSVSPTAWSTNPC